MVDQTERTLNPSDSITLPYAGKAQRPASGFWRRQFDDHPTRGQHAFDLILAFIVTPACLYFDPMVFRPTDAVLAENRMFAWGFICFQLIGFAAWKLNQVLGQRRATQQGSAAQIPSAWNVDLLFHASVLGLGGFLLMGALFAGGLAVVLAPLSAIGLLFYGIGALGTAPLFIAFAWSRNAVRTMRLSGDRVRTAGGVWWCIFGAIVAIAIPTWLASILERAAGQM